MKFNANIYEQKDRGRITSYYAYFVFEDKEETYCEGGNWYNFCADVLNKTGITLPRRKECIFETLSDFEKICGINASAYYGAYTDAYGCFVPLGVRSAIHWDIWTFPERRTV